tara:strand:+ start:136 stop:459 length:324 start_codon:yes stop_codon:yes gene_type:complete
MTKNSDEFNPELLEDLIFKLELKEAFEAGDIGQINFCLKHIIRHISTSTQIQNGLVDKQTEMIKNNEKLMKVNSELSKTFFKQITEYGEMIIKLAERVNELEGARND